MDRSTRNEVREFLGDSHWHAFRKIRSMHTNPFSLSLAFEIKRAYRAALAARREALLPYGITPARFDLLCAVRDHRGVTQADLARILHVTPATVSRMVNALFSLGLLSARGTRNGKTRKLSLTLEGTGLVMAARAEFRMVAS